MTTEQNEQWKEVVLPLAFRLTGEKWKAEQVLVALLPPQEQTKRLATVFGEQRLTAWGVPFWLRELRLTLLTWNLGNSISPWIIRFALRSTTVLVGLKIIYPHPVIVERAQQRFFLRFVANALRPFVKYAHQTDSYRRAGYETLIELYDLCEQCHTSVDAVLWSRFSDLFPYLESEPYNYRSEYLEIYAAHCMGRELFQAINNVLDPEEKTFWTGESAFDVVELIDSLNNQHQLRLNSRAKEWYEAGPNYAELIAEAFLTALEAECPPPDWLPRI